MEGFGGDARASEGLLDCFSYEVDLVHGSGAQSKSDAAMVASGKIGRGGCFCVDIYFYIVILVHGRNAICDPYLLAACL